MDKFSSKHHAHIPTTSTPLTEKLDQKRETITKARSTGEGGGGGTRAGGREGGRERECERVRGWDGDSERTITMKHHTWFSTYFVFIVNLSMRINKQFNHIFVATVRSKMKSCPTIL